ncbi:hypothetical protein Vadar_020200 [Vaccinium darrowii]|uniref:Uncharacterized protein n=1 Tax=Vaccinium darrowii TaxID=229202 RepID=A0ACB7XB90_9ERIC|nr:hypothetical protein Vadar_020200 [Vaccinium darrowii]
MVEDLLGLNLQGAVGRRGNKVTLQWLRQHFNGEVEETDTQVQIEKKARGYIMQLIGGVLVPDQSSSRVHLCYLELLRDLKVVGQWDDKFHSPDLATHFIGHYRHSLDMQKPDEVIWQPNSDELIELLHPLCSLGGIFGGQRGLMCIVAQEKFLWNEPLMHGVWSLPAVVEEEEGVEDEGNVEVHADKEVGVDANVEATEGELHDAHAHGKDMVAQPHPQ